MERALDLEEGETGRGLEETWERLIWRRKASALVTATPRRIQWD
jgi:hypothetical protein